MQAVDDTGSERHGIDAIHSVLRERILRGELSPGQALSQVDLAREFQVSRTPVREALRMLQHEGLLLAEHNHQMRVATLGVDQLEAIYARRVLVESLGVSLTVPLLNQAELADLGRLVEEMAALTRDRDLEAWEAPHDRFHRMLFGHAPVHLRPSIERDFELGERFRRLYRRLHGADRDRTEAEEEHEAILDACQRTDGAEAGRRLARHLAHTAVSLAGELEPGRVPFTVRRALAMVTGEGPESGLLLGMAASPAEPL